MRILIVVATYQEIAPLFKKLSIPEKGLSFTYLAHKIDILVTGVGMVATAYALGKALESQNYDIAINAGIAGSFSKRIAIGEVVQVKKDILAELGAEDDEEFLSLEEMQLGEVEFLQQLHDDFETDLKKVTGITVNKVHGNEDSIEDVKERLFPQTESMEGAAFFYACEEAGVAGMQVRAISNYVEKRNKANWNIPLAVKNLNEWLGEYLNTLSKK
ncbi:futalosine hydrolase [Pedobacter puniceum]|jgi:futalosine hydrolase|uniref:Futalosine hydrolase n=1 Tax=Pedobacter puniceum TaxID=2666136 RepID=A0A7K0FNS4_9SPHI|nr:futalosine hydrolase [Pedobacter puniceum]MRX47639.1 futalosine hydrolase [Pedobacter puniceum]